MCLYPIRITVRPKGAEPFRQTVSCGNCLECLRQKSFEWAFRLLDEASQFKDNCFVTLTYNNDNLPNPPDVSRREIQLFVKRLRKRLSPLKIRFFACGEYGSKFGRPHYHLIIFNWFPSDAVLFDTRDKLYRSKLLECCWTKGFSSVGKVSFDSALYCAKYMNKFQFIEAKCWKRDIPVIPPFVQMSNRPGIGFNSVYRCDLKSDRIYRNGKSTKIPRYYLKVMERDGVFLDEFKELRQRNGEHVASVTDIEVKRKRYKDKFLNTFIVKK